MTLGPLPALRLISRQSTYRDSSDGRLEARRPSERLVDLPVLRWVTRPDTAIMDPGFAPGPRLHLPPLPSLTVRGSDAWTSSGGPELGESAKLTQVAPQVALVDDGPIVETLAEPHSNLISRATIEVDLSWLDRSDDEALSEVISRLTHAVAHKLRPLLVKAAKTRSEVPIDVTIELPGSPVATLIDADRRALEDLRIMVAALRRAKDVAIDGVGSVPRPGALSIRISHSGFDGLLMLQRCLDPRQDITLHLGTVARKPSVRTTVDGTEVLAISTTAVLSVAARNVDECAFLSLLQEISGVLAGSLQDD